jgi:hypothetical protein
VGVKLDAGSNNRFPAVTWVDANKQGDAVNLIFGTRVEGQGGSQSYAYVFPMGKSQIPR